MEALGNCTEEGILGSFHRNGFAVEELCKRRDFEKGYNIAELDVPFNSDRKRCRSAYKVDVNGTQMVRVVVKGGPDKILEICEKTPTFVQKKDGSLKEL